MTRYLVCGGRDFTDMNAISRVFDELEIWPDDEICHGAARGADTLAGIVASGRGVKVTRFPADWSHHGKAAGAIRNQQMLDEFKPDIVLAFPGGNGTADMCRRAKASGVLVIQSSELASTR